VEEPQLGRTGRQLQEAERGAEGREATVSHGMSIRYSPTRGSVAGAPMFMK
jgi:hypothetical protein